MKKLLTVVLAIAMIASLACVAAFADGELNKINLKATTVEVEEGATEVKVPITVEYASGTLLGAMFTVKAEGATVAKVAKGSVVEGQFQGSVEEGVATVMIVNGSDADASMASGSELAIVTLTLAEAAKEGASVKVIITPDEKGANFCDAELNDQEGVGGEFDAIKVAKVTEPVTTEPVTTEPVTTGDETTAPVTTGDDTTAPATSDDDTTPKADDTTKADDKKPSAPVTGDAAIVVVVAMVVALGAAIVVKKVNVK